MREVEVDREVNNGRGSPAVAVTVDTSTVAIMEMIRVWLGEASLTVAIVIVHDDVTPLTLADHVES